MVTIFATLTDSGLSTLPSILPAKFKIVVDASTYDLNIDAKEMVKEILLNRGIILEDGVTCSYPGGLLRVERLIAKCHFIES